MYHIASSLRSNATRSFVFASAPKSFAATATEKSTKQKRPFWATTPAQKTKEKPAAAAATAGDEEEEHAAVDDKKSFNTTQLVKLVAETHDITQAQAKRIIDTVFHTIAETVAEKKAVAISGFGSFKTRVSKPYTARNPSTGAPIPVPSKNRIKFTPYTNFKKSTEPIDEATATATTAPVSTPTPV